MAGISVAAVPFGVLAILAIYCHSIGAASAIAVAWFIWKSMTISASIALFWAPATFTAIFKRKSRANAAHVKLCVIMLTLMLFIAIGTILDCAWRYKGADLTYQDLLLLLLAGLVGELALVLLLTGFETTSFAEKPWWQVLGDLRWFITAWALVNLIVLVFAIEVMVGSKLAHAGSKELVLAVRDAESNAKRTSWFTLPVRWGEL